MNGRRALRRLRAAALNRCSEISYDEQSAGPQSFRIYTGQALNLSLLAAAGRLAWQWRRAVGRLAEVYQIDKSIAGCNWDVIGMAATDIRHQTPEQYLAAADREFAAGNHDDGSELLYQSVVCALMQLAADYGRPCGTRAELNAFAGWLDEKRGLDRWHTLKMVSALNFHDNAKYHYLPYEEMAYSVPSVQEFVAVLMSYRKVDGFP